MPDLDPAAVEADENRRHAAAFEALWQSAEKQARETDAECIRLAAELAEARAAVARLEAERTELADRLRAEFGSEGLVRIQDVAAFVAEAHEHEWVDARNSAVVSGEVCVRCGAVRSAPVDEAKARGFRHCPGP